MGKCIFYLSCARTMSEPPKRNSTRERKPNRFLQLDDSEVGNYSASRLGEQREIRPNTSQANQIAKLFLRFLLSINKKFRDYADQDPHQESPQQHPSALQSFRNSNAPTRAADRRSANTDAGTNPANKKGADPRRTTAEDGARQNQKPAEKKKGESGKQAGSHSLGFQQDLGGSGTVSQRQRLPPAENIALISQAAIRASMQKALLQKNGEKGEGRKKKGGSGLEAKSQRQQLKPFKRQSYHVAIAYHIHLKRVKPNENSNANDIDPTYNARKLREQQEKQQ